MLNFPWRALSSERFAAVLVILMSIAAGIAAVVPQGAIAVDLAREPTATTMHTLFAYGLTDIFGSAWVKVIAALLLGNVAAILVRRRYDAKAALTETPPRDAPLSLDLRAERPERAVELVRGALSARVGPPRLEVAEGSKVALVFDSGSGVAAAPLVTHLGLLVAVMAAGIEVSTMNPKDAAPAAVLLVTDSTNGTLGRFNMVAGEQFEFFQFSAKYVLREYVRSRGNLGPAIRIERIARGQREGPSFWVYENAPKGFDQRHRAGEVFIDVESSSLKPLPGKGLTGKPTGALLLLGFALVAFGALRGQGASGRLWVLAEGAQVKLVGEPDVEGDRDFESRFESWTLDAKEVLEST
ncbi:MAG: cytochrome c biogenesis protein ResB [Deltaproteobacteria bacterium]|nr:cytochrome c biogenesis protein ResB [Deltaproteobacteria bacterium]